MERNDPLSFHFPCWKPQARCSIWIPVKTIHCESPDLITSCSTPTSNEQCSSLIGTGKCADRFHQPCEFVFRDVAGNALWDLRQISDAEQWSLWHIFPFPTRDIPKKHREIGQCPSLR